MDDRPESVCAILSRLLAAVNGVSLLVFGTTGLQVRARFREILADLLEGHALPVATQVVLCVPAWSVLAAMGLLLALLVAKEWLRPRWLPLVLNVVWLLLGLVAACGFVAAMMLPLVRIVSQLGNV